MGAADSHRSPGGGSRPAPPVRARIVVRGAVQGVGFRPFVHRLARELGLAGWVRNSPRGVTIEVEGQDAAVREFLVRLEPEQPPRAFIQGIEPVWLEPAGLEGFAIRPSEAEGDRATIVLPDLATCLDCLREVFDPSDRRYLYPFTNCTNCGPRFSIIEAMPYDRSRTSMRLFPLCEDCRREYEDPSDRRFHAEPVACPRCGPQVRLLAPDGGGRAGGRAALDEAVRVLGEGGIVAVKGLGGYQLVADATRSTAVRALRARKRREEKPLALMFPNLASVREVCYADALEERILRSPEGPITLLRKRPGEGRVSSLVAPGMDEWGVMLPTTPLHHILLRALGRPVVATSGNLNDEPICIDEDEALLRLGAIADAFLVHDRVIVRHVDDSIVRVVLGREMVLRRARGYAPWPIDLPGMDRGAGGVVLGMGADLKNTVALGCGSRVVVSQHIGDLGTESSLGAHGRVAADLVRLFEAPPAVVACDLHPDYHSTRAAGRTGLRVVPVQHHLAHAMACLAENEVRAPALAVTWDGTGFGTDGTIWGGEFLRIDPDGWRRVAHLRPFPLAGGDGAAREPRRAALGLLHALWGDDAWGMADLPPLQAFTEVEQRVWKTLLGQGRHVVATTSAGRFIDAMASLVGVRQVSRFEAQTAMRFEALAAEAGADPAADPLAGFVLAPSGDDRPWVLDWGPLVTDLVARVRRGDPAAGLAAAVHEAMVQAVVAVARRCGADDVALTGGCFQNRLLLCGAVRALRAAGFRPCWPQRIPPNDGGISLGQVVAAGTGHA